MNSALPATSLHEAFATVADPRSRVGRSYTLASLPTLAAVARLRGCRGLYAIAQWGRDSNHLAPLLGFPRPAKDRGGYRTPCVSELHTVFAALDVSAFEAALRCWIVARGVADLDQRVVALDGKTLGGSQGHQLPGVHLLPQCRGGPRSTGRPGQDQRTQNGAGAAEAHPLAGDVTHRRCGLHPARPVCGGGSRPGGLLPDRPEQPADAGGGHPGGLQPGFFPRERPSDEPPRTTGPKARARATAGWRSAGS